jgi:hypothetical protein
MKEEIKNAFLGVTDGRAPIRPFSAINYLLDMLTCKLNYAIAQGFSVLPNRRAVSGD